MTLSGAGPVDQQDVALMRQEVTADVPPCDTALDKTEKKFGVSEDSVRFALARGSPVSIVVTVVRTYVLYAMQGKVVILSRVSASEREQTGGPALIGNGRH